jgi:hypothetical protein
MPAWIGLGLERHAHDLLEQRRRQVPPALGERALGEHFAGQDFHVFGQGTGPRQDMKAQPRDQFAQAQQRRTTAPGAAPSGHGADRGRVDQLVEQRLEGRRRETRLVSHPQRNATECPIAQGQNGTRSTRYALMADAFLPPILNGIG